MNWRMFTVSILAFLLPGVAVSQQGGAAGGGGNTSGGGSVGSGTTTGRTTTRSPAEESPFDRRPIFLSGKVVLAEGAPPPEQVKIERVCNGNVRIEGYTDRRGIFSIELGRSFQMQDASIGSDAFGTLGGDPFNTGNRNDPMRNMRTGSPQGVSERELWNCEIRAALAGYRSDVISLAGRRALDNPDIGTIVLRRYSKNSEGLTVSATSALAPKDAKKAYEKALDSIKKKNPDEAQEYLEKAVAAYPRYAAAWAELGKLYEQRDHMDEAHKAYQQGLTADSRFLPLYEGLSRLALRSSNWQELADVTDRFLQLDPLTYPDAYYMNSIANLQLRHFDAAEKSAKEAIRLDPARRNMRSYYILGLAQASQQNFAASLESLKVFMTAPPPGTDLDSVRKQVAQIEEASHGPANAPLAAQPSQPQQ
jgi:tetratricopeptide (TPR) repeat protein